MSGVPYPDLFVAFDADPAGYLARNGYVISEQGKPPDFVLEIASRSTGRRDTVDKRISYAALGIQEYWRFDETGQFHGTRLAGDSLVNGQYEPLPIEALTDGSRATAPSSASTCAGPKANWAGMTPTQANTSRRWTTLRPAPMRQRPEYGSWKTSSAS